MDIELKGEQDATVWIYEPIGSDLFGGVSANDFVTAIAPLKSRDITIRINSPGGDAFDGVAMLNLLKERRRKTAVIVDGLAASAASIVAMGGDTIEMAEGAMMMIHRAHVFARGSASELRDAANLLDKVDGNITKIYSFRSGMDEDAVSAALDAETWYTAEEAVAAGLADTVGSQQAVAAYLQDLPKIYDRPVPKTLKTAICPAASAIGPSFNSTDIKRRQVELTRKRISV